MKEVHTHTDGSSNQNLIELANSKIDIYSVCDLVGVDYAAYHGTTSKLYCPFGYITHIDGGATRALRIYPDTNSMYCFACQQYYDPVGLFSSYADLSREEAALSLLEGSGWKPETFEDKWEKLNKREEFNTEPVLEALNSYCLRLDDMWAVNSMYPPHSSRYLECLQLLQKVRNLKDAERWLTAAKKYLGEVLE